MAALSRRLHRHVHIHHVHRVGLGDELVAAGDIWEVVMARPGCQPPRRRARAAPCEDREWRFAVGGACLASSRRWRCAEAQRGAIGAAAPCRARDLEDTSPAAKGCVVNRCLCFRCECTDAVSASARERIPAASAPPILFLQPPQSGRKYSTIGSADISRLPVNASSAPARPRRPHRHIAFTAARPHDAVEGAAVKRPPPAAISHSAL